MTARSFWRYARARMIVKTSIAEPLQRRISRNSLLKRIYVWNRWHHALERNGSRPV